MNKKKTQKKIWIIGIIIILIIGGVSMILYKPEIQTLTRNLINQNYLNTSSESSIPITQTFYIGDYVVLSKSGNESVYDVNITKLKSGNSLICLEAGGDIKEVEDIKYKIDSKTGEEKEIITKYNYTIPSTLSFYKTEELTKETNLIKTKESSLSATSPINPNKFCYEADPNKDFYLKFGDNSIIVIQETQVSTDSILNNVTAEGNFTHLNISNTAPYNSLIGYWNFDGDAENTLLTTHYDWSKNNMDGTGIGKALVNNTDCIYGDCARFDGGTTAIDTSSFSINIFTGFVFSFWMKTTATTGMPLSWGPSSKRFCRIGGVTANKLNCAVDGGSTGSSTSVTSINDGNWHYIAISSNGTNQQLYIDGINEGNATETLSTTSGEIRIGGYATSGGYYYNGAVDEVMIFNTTLTSAQVLAIYNNQSARFLGTGTQNIVNQAYMNISTGNNRVNVTTYIDNLFSSSINLSVGYYDSGWGWQYTAPQVVNSGVVQTFDITPIFGDSSNLTFNYTFYAGNSTNPFYSPIIKSNITFEAWYFKETEITTCTILDSPNTVYTQQANIVQTANTVCINISAQNITYNGNGYSITQSTNYNAISSNQYNTTIKNCNINGSSLGYGINLNSANNSYIFNNTITILGYGIGLSSVSNVIIENNTQSKSTNVGISISNSNNNIIRGNSVNNNYDYDSSGIYIVGNNNTIINNTLYSNGNQEIQVNGDSNIITNNDIQNCSGFTSVRSCIEISGNNNILENNIINKSAGGGIVISGNNTLLKNTNMTNIAGTSVNILNGINNTFLNFSYYNESVVSGGQLIRKWYYMAYVNDTSGNNVSNANITAYNVTGSYNFNLTTDSTGCTGLGQIIDYVNNGTRTYYSNYTIYAINSSYQTGSHTYNVTEKQSNYKDIFTLTLISVNCWTKTENVLFIPTGCVYQLNKGEKIEI